MTLYKFQQPATKPDVIFNDFFNELSSLNKKPSTNFSPLVNITENKENYNLELFAPGRLKNDFSINIDKNLLTISSEQKEQPKDETVLHVRKEFSLGSFKRSFTLDDKVSFEKIEARYENGVLKILLPKKEEVNTTKEIVIQ